MLGEWEKGVTILDFKNIKRGEGMYALYRVLFQMNEGLQDIQNNHDNNLVTPVSHQGNASQNWVTMDGRCGDRRE